MRKVEKTQMDKFSKVNRRLFDEATRVVLQSVDVLEKNWTVKRRRKNQKKGCTLARLMHHQMHGCWEYTRWLDAPLNNAIVRCKIS